MAEKWQQLTTHQLRAGAQLTERGGLGMDIKLQMIANTPQVFWTKLCNSYVVTRSIARPGTLLLVSINGMGEIRWDKEISDDSIERMSWWNEHDREAFGYFFEPKA